MVTPAPASWSPIPVPVPRKAGAMASRIITHDTTNVKHHANGGRPSRPFDRPCKQEQNSRPCGRPSVSTDYTFGVSSLFRAAA